MNQTNQINQKKQQGDPHGDIEIEDEGSDEMTMTKENQSDIKKGTTKHEFSTIKDLKNVTERTEKNDNTEKNF